MASCASKLLRYLACADLRIRFAGHASPQTPPLTAPISPKIGWEFETIENERGAGLGGEAGSRDCHDMILPVGGQRGRFIR